MTMMMMIMMRHVTSVDQEFAWTFFAKQLLHVIHRKVVHGLRGSVSTPCKPSTLNFTAAVLESIVTAPQGAHYAHIESVSGL